MAGIRRVLTDFRHMKMYFLITGLIFALGIWFGASSTLFHGLLEGQLEGLEELAATVESAENQTLALFLIIFLNNAIKAVAIVFLGLLFAFLPVFFVAINGMVLGFLFSTMHGMGENIVPLIVKGILPHGIIELPVILLASAYGIRLGIDLLKWIVSTGEERKQNKDKLFQLLKLTGSLSIFIVVSLLVAAIIEATITPWLLAL